MFENLLWQLRRLPKNSKVIIWTATVHAAKQQGPLREKPLGAFVAERWHDAAAAIGFSARGGQSAMAGGPAKEISAAPEDALETVATANDSVAFLDAAALQAVGTKPARLFGSFSARQWRDFFDGVVVFRVERPPQ
jgi:erythromycin esterase-like protein